MEEKQLEPKIFACSQSIELAEKIAKSDTHHKNQKLLWYNPAADKSDFALLA